jgi:hypothetical protein
MRMANLMARLTFLAVSLCCCDSFAGTPSPPRFGLFVYSNFCISPMSDDLHGARITLRRLSDGDMLVYEYTDGSTHALIAEKLTLDDRAGTVQFEVRALDGAGARLSGKFSGDGRVLKLRGMLYEDEGAVITLTKTRDLGGRVAQCKETPK